MCIAILNKSVELSREALNNCWVSNRNGAGILYTKGEKLEIIKELTSFEAFYQAYLTARAATSLPMLLHFRISTSGKVNEENCHPFLIPGHSWGLVHNGVIDVHSDKEHSDTWHFANCYLPTFRDLTCSWTQHMIDNMAGSYNKLLFLSDKGEFFIINEKAGHWDKAGDTWYSNDSYKSDRWSYYGNQRYERGTTYSGIGVGGLRRMQDHDDWGYDRGMNAEDDEVRYEQRNVWAENARRANRRASFRKELEARTKKTDLRPHQDTLLEQQYQDYVAVQDLGHELLSAFERSLADRKNGLVTKFKKPETEAKYQAWFRYQRDLADLPEPKPAAATPKIDFDKFTVEEVAAIGKPRDTFDDFPKTRAYEAAFDAEFDAWCDARNTTRKAALTAAMDAVKKTASAGAGSSATNSAGVGAAPSYGVSRHEGDTRDDSVGCVTCGKVGLEYDETEDAHWCHDCFEYRLAHEVFEAGAAPFAGVGSFD